MLYLLYKVFFLFGRARLTLNDKGAKSCAPKMFTFTFFKNKFILFHVDGRAIAGFGTAAQYRLRRPPYRSRVPA
jgi:hypothetical protein